MPDDITQLKDFINSVPFIDTHSHMAGFDEGSPVDDRGGRSLPQIIANDYLSYLASSCIELPAPPGPGGWRVENAEDHFRALLPLLDVCRGLSTYAALREGIRELHPFEGEDISPDNWEALNDSIVAAYRTHGERAWQRRACERAGVIRQTQMCVLPYVTDHWEALPPEEREAQRRLLLPSLIMDGYLFTGFDAAAPGRERTMEILGMRPATHAEYLDFCNAALDLFKGKGGRSVKFLTAYHRTLRFGACTDADAVPLFAQGPENLPGEKLARLQDNLFVHLVRMARDKGLPAIFHTGYTTPTEWGNPEHLLPLFRDPELRGLKVDVSHSGWPNVGGALIMARAYRGCYFNLCWTPLLSPSLGHRVLSEALDMVPMNKILLGTDCGSAEMFLGTVRLIRSQLFEVLSEKCAQGQFGLKVAKRIASALLKDNAAEFYGLEE